MTIADILKQFTIWRSLKTDLRFGQWFLNTFYSRAEAPEIFYCRRPTQALNMILRDARFCSEVYTDC